MGCRGVVGGRVHDVIGPHHQRDVGGLELVVDLVHLFELLIRDVRLRQQDVHVARHPTGDRVDRVLDLDAALLQLVGQLPHRMLALGDREPVAGDDDDLARVGE